MRRLLLNVLTVLSLLVCLAGAAEWARSYFAADVVSVRSGRRQTDVFSDGGSYVFRTAVYPVEHGRDWAWEVDGVRVDAASAFRGLTRFEWTTQGLFGPVLHVIGPQWTVPAAFGILPAVRLARWRRRRRLARHRGFDVEPVKQAL